jgi:hypothetical protein
LILTPPLIDSLRHFDIDFRLSIPCRLRLADYAIVFSEPGFLFAFALSLISLLIEAAEAVFSFRFLHAFAIASAAIFAPLPMMPPQLFLAAAATFIAAIISLFSPPAFHYAFFRYFLQLSSCPLSLRFRPTIAFATPAERRRTARHRNIQHAPRQRARYAASATYYFRRISADGIDTPPLSILAG